MDNLKQLFSDMYWFIIVSQVYSSILRIPAWLKLFSVCIVYPVKLTFAVSIILLAEIHKVDVTYLENEFIIRKSKKWNCYGIVLWWQFMSGNIDFNNKYSNTNPITVSKLIKRLTNMIRLRISQKQDFQRMPRYWWKSFKHLFACGRQ